ncbi:MAG: DUF2937 family protein [Pseudomonadota bacterium]
MILRAMTFAGALAGGAGLSQFPEYATQYEQRLAGAADEMRAVVANFDGMLADLGQTRDQAFAPDQDLSERETRMLGNAQNNINRLAFLETALARVQDASVFEKMTAMPRIADRQIGARAFEDFKPAVPLNVDGIACAGLGFIGGWVLFSLLIGALRLPFRRRKDATA